jgi:hypothetical protein
MLGPKTNMQWPSREQWATARQSTWWDCEDRPPFHDRYSHRLSDYATFEEIAAAIETLQQAWHDIGNDMKRIKLELDTFAIERQRGEGSRGYYNRYKTLPESNRRKVSAHSGLRIQRHTIREIITLLREDVVPQGLAWKVGEKAKQAITPFEERYVAAFKQASDAWKQERLATPVDDPAWAEELKQRQLVEDDAGRFFAQYRREHA